MKLGPEIRAVTFDVGGTLIKPWPSVGHIYSEVAARHGRNIDSSLLERRFADAWKELRNFNHTRDEWAALVNQTFGGLFENPCGETFFTELYDRFSEPKAWRIFEDVQPALEELAACSIKLGIISNWDERLRPLLDKLELSKYFEVILVSCEAGFPKPSPVIFEQAAKKLGVDPRFILHVGDSETQDVKGARAAGYQARLLERAIMDASDGSIRSLSELQRH